MLFELLAKRATDPEADVQTFRVPLRQTTWHTVKDHMKEIGKVQFCSVLTEDGTEWGRRGW